MTDNVKVNEFVMRFYNAVDEKSMTEYYLLHQYFNGLSESERDAALLNILFYNALREVKR